MPKNILIPDRAGRKSHEEIQQIVSREYGVFLLDCVSCFTPTCKALRYSGSVATHRRFVGGSHVTWLARQRDGEFLAWETPVVPESLDDDYVVFILSMSMGWGAACPQPSGRFDLYLNDAKALSFYVVMHDKLWRNEKEDISFYYQVRRLEAAPRLQSLVLDSELRKEQRATFGNGLLKVPRDRLIAGRTQRIRIVPVNRSPSRRWVRVDEFSSSPAFMETNFYPGLEPLVHGEKREQAAGYKVYFGDIHTHSGLGIQGEETGCGVGTLDEHYQYARDVAALDIYCLSDHDKDILDQDDWRRRQEKTEEYYAPGRFVTLSAFEWTSQLYGHRVVYYRGIGEAFFSSRRNDGRQGQVTPDELYAFLDSRKAEALVVPHHPARIGLSMCWEYHSPKYERLAEIYSIWGDSERQGNPYHGYGSDALEGLYVQDALARGYRLGFIASSDGHDGNPGNAQWLPQKSHMAHFLGSGRVGVLAHELTREAVYDAMKARRVYATTGAPIVLEFSLGGHLMGEEVAASSLAGHPVIKGRIRGTCEIAGFHIISNGRTVFYRDCHCEAREEIFEFTDTNFVPGKATYYYLRVHQRDHEIAWTSPVWIV